MASKRLERRKDKFKFTATYVEADQYSMMTRPDHWSEHKYVLLQIPVFNCLHCFHPFSRHLCECQQLCESLCWKLHPVWAAHMQFWKSEPKKCTILFPNVGRCKCKVPFAKLPATHLQIEKLSKLFNSIEKLETSKLSLDFQSAFTLASPTPAPQVSNVTAIFAICGDRQEPRLVMILVAKIKFSFPYSEPSNRITLCVCVTSCIVIHLSRFKEKNMRRIWWPF